MRHRRYDDARAVAADGRGRWTPTHAAAELAGQHPAAPGRRGGAAWRCSGAAWNRDPYDVRTYNLLNLFEKVIPARYVDRHQRPPALPGRARGPRRDRAGGRARSSRSATRDYVARYGFEPAGPVDLRAVRRPAHYAVRTVGLPRLGVAGVCFGRVITSQSPTNRAFNWGMVLAHELAHVFALAAVALARAALVHRGAGRAGDAAGAPSGGATTTWRCTAPGARGELPRCRPVQRLRQRPRRRRRPPRPTCTPRWRSSSSSGASASPRIREALVAYGRGERTRSRAGAAVGHVRCAALRRRSGPMLGKRFAALRAPVPPHPDGAPREPPEARDWISAGPAATLDAARRGSATSCAPLRALTGRATRRHLLFLDGRACARAPRGGPRPPVAFRASSRWCRPRDGYDVRVRLALAEIHRKRRRRRRDPPAPRHRAAIPRASSRRPCWPSCYGADAAQGRAAGGAGGGPAARAPDRQPGQGGGARAARAGRTARVLELAPIADLHRSGRPDLHAALGRALAATGKPAAAAAAFERALRLRRPRPGRLHSPAPLAGALRHAGRPAASAAAHRGCASAEVRRRLGRTRGSVERERRPAPGALSTSIRPPCSTTICCTSARPRPVPFSLVEKNGSKILPRCSGAMPGPESATRSITRPASVRVDGQRWAQARVPSATGTFRPVATRPSPRARCVPG